MRFENKRICTEPDAIKEALKEYCREIEMKFKPACIILYGSRAKETFTNLSDIDIIVISNNFEQDFLSRIKDLIDANTSSVPIEPLAIQKQNLKKCLWHSGLRRLMLYMKGCHCMVKIISKG